MIFTLIFSNSTNLYTSRILSQADEYVLTVQNLSETQEKLKKYIENVRDAEYTTSIFNYQIIKEETESFVIKAKDFADQTIYSETSRHNFEIVCLALISALIITAIISYLKKNSTIILITSILILTLIIPTLIIEGLNASQFILSIDLCKDINKHIQAESLPTAGKGIGVYVSCPSKPVQVMINTARFEIGNSFNQLFYNVKQNMADKHSVDLGNLKRNNKIFTDFAETYKDNEYLFNSLNSLILYNQILTGLEGLITCQLADDMLNYTEEKFCYRNITYEFNSMMFYFVGIFGMVILTIGVNKLIVLLSPIYSNLGSKNNGLELLNETTG